MLLLAPHPSSTVPQQGVIEEARRRQRRRRSIAGALLVAATLLGIAVYVTSGGANRAVRPSQRAPAPASSAAQQQPQRLFTQEPAMGVACPGAPNSIACDRILFGVWLRRPAVAVDATIAGRSFKLDDAEWSRALQQGALHNGRRTVFVGALQPAGLINGPLKVHTDRGRYYWIGSHPVFAHVRVVVHYGHGETASTAFGLELRPGWG